MAKPVGLRIKAIEYINQGRDIRDIARTCGVSIWTIRRWKKLYDKGGFTRLSRIPAWNITSETIAKKVYILKEENPRITLMQAKNKLSSKGMHFSLEGIRKIWQRYGLIGYDKKKQIVGIVPMISLSKNVKQEIEKVAKILEKTGNIKEAAKILNRLAYCGGSEILTKVPYRYLNLRRRVEVISAFAGREPLNKYYKRVHCLRLALEKKKLFYSSLRVGIIEVNILFWLGRQQPMLDLIEHLEKRMPKQGDPVLQFNLKLLKGMVLARLLKLKEALHCANECKRHIKKFSDATFYFGLGNLYSNIGMYLRARDWYERANRTASGMIREQSLLSLIGCYALNGEYEKVFKTIKEIEDRNLPIYTFIPLVRAQAFFGQGRLEESAQCAKTAIEVVKRNEIVQYLHAATMVLSAIYYSSGEKKKGKLLIKNMLPLLRKNRMVQDYYIRKLFSIGNTTFLPERYKKEPFIRLILLMKRANQTLRLKDYNNALRFATQKGLKGYLHRLCVFYPEIILKLIEKGKPGGLPRVVLRLPVFNKEVLVCRIKFLGDLVVFKNQEYLKTKLRPKDTAFLIYLCQKAMEPKKFVNLDEVYANFWSKSEKASRNFSHLLVRIKKTLKIPTHLLEISRGSGTSVLINQGIYFTTDYQEFEHTLAQAKALQRAGEWSFARKEYLRAFKLFRGEPFKKNFDNWSVDLRFRILSQLETEAISFAKSCLEHSNKTDARKILQKVLKIIPDSKEAVELLRITSSS
ncbi:MAG: helix-turn-helix domain-containing protein [candidate division WOR-3 bacterium]